MAANMSVGALYHYFPTKRDLVLYPLQPLVCEEGLRRFEARHGHLREVDPQRYLDLFMEEQVQALLLLRPAVQAAFELGSGMAWQTIQEGFDVEMRDLVRDIQRLGGGAAKHDPAALERAIRRLFLSAVLDTTTTLDEVRAELYALILSRPLTGPNGALLGGHNEGIPDATSVAAKSVGA